MSERDRIMAPPIETRYQRAYAANRDTRRAKARARYARDPESARTRASHYRKTALQLRSWRRMAYMLVVRQEMGGCCVDCGENYPLFLEFDHIDRLTKAANISDIYTLRGIRAEAQKCVLRCANCHGLKTWIQGDWRNGAH